MRFIFNEKNKFEVDIITDILDSENIRYRINENKPEIPIGVLFCYPVLSTYDITIDVSLEKFDFIKKLIEDRIGVLTNLEKCYAIQNSKDNISNRKQLQDLENELNYRLNQIFGAKVIHPTPLYTIPTSQSLTFTVKEYKPARKKHSLLKKVGLWLAKRGK